MEEILKGKCIDYTFDAKGIIKDKGKPTFIPGIIKGEEIEYKIVSENKNYFEGELVKIIKPSLNRVRPVCFIYKECGGCQLQQMNYEEQLIFKKSQIENCFQRIAKMNVKVNDCIGMKNPYNYRNKVQIPFGFKKKEVVYGFYRQGTHDIVNMKTCHLQENIVTDILDTVKELFKKYKLDIYNEDRGTGILRHVLIKRGFSSNQTMVVLITNVEDFPKRSDIVKEVLKKHSDVKTIVQNINKRKTNVILGEKERILFGKGYIEDELLGIKFRISSKSFYQVNPVQTEVLYSKAIEMASLSKQDRVLDAYCGIGTISLALSQHVSEVIGVEIVKEAIQDAKNNAQNNNIKNVHFVCDDASKFMDEFTNVNEKIDIVFVDPPRKGCDESFINSLLKLQAKKIIYISCDPSTLARDIAMLSEKYKVVEIQPVDMFPQTYHIETIVSLIKNK